MCPRRSRRSVELAQALARVSRPPLVAQDRARVSPVLAAHGRARARAQVSDAARPARAASLRLEVRSRARREAPESVRRHRSRV